MKTTVKKNLGRGVFGAFLLLMTGLVFKAGADGPYTAPLDKDKQAAARTALPRTGGEDARVDLPEGPRVAGNGLVEPADREVKVAAAVPGLVAAIRVKEGERVSAGAVLVELDAAAERAALAAAEADVSAAETELARSRKGLRAEDVDAAVADAEAARARAELSKTTLARTETLARTGAATAEELDRARQSAANDEATFRSIEARKRAAKLGSRAEDIAVAAARVEAARARRDQARAVADRMVVKAPADGEILEVKFRVGEYYTPQGTEPLLVMGDTRVLRVRMDVDERDVSRVGIGAPAFAVADGFPGQTFKGKVVEIGHRMGRKNIRTDEPTERIDTKILEVLIQLDAPGPLVPGLRVLSYVTLPAKGA
jgi:HlyD family secretion protein